MCYESEVEGEQGGVKSKKETPNWEKMKNKREIRHRNDKNQQDFRQASPLKIHFNMNNYVYNRINKVVEYFPT